MNVKTRVRPAEAAFLMLLAAVAAGLIWGLMALGV